MKLTITYNKLCHNPKCTIKIAQELTQFYKARSNPDGYSYWCKTCINNYNKTEHSKVLRSDAVNRHMQTDTYKNTRKEYNRTESSTRYYHTKKGRINSVNNQLKRKYGITLEFKQQLYDSQLGLCKLCSKKLPDIFKSHLDHNHNTGEIRGILCVKCNHFIGHIETNIHLLKAACEYAKINISDILKEDI